MNILSNSGKIAYGIKHFLISSDSELSNLPFNVAPGSSATNPSTGHKWVFNGQMWVSSTAPSPAGTLDDSYAMTEADILEILK